MRTQFRFCIMLARLSDPLRRHPVAWFYGLTCLISWTGAFLVAAPALLRREPVSQLTGLLMFPAMLLGPPLSGILLTGLLEGRTGLRALLARFSPRRVITRSAVLLLLPPALIFMVLATMSRVASPNFAPNLFLPGFFFGVPAGLLEEVGWIGFAFPRLCAGQSRLKASVQLGLLWSLWHLPVINYLGAVTPHGQWWPVYFLAFALAMTAMRVLIGWMVSDSNSLLLAQLMHISSTGSLVVLSPPRASAAQETLWYAVYGVLLWCAVFAGTLFLGRWRKGQRSEEALTRQAV
jgi:membrane protease YdiL (CAAX protease family)